MDVESLYDIKLLVLCFCYLVPRCFYIVISFNSNCFFEFKRAKSMTFYASL